jgi:hypothetical protein
MWSFTINADGDNPKGVQDYVIPEWLLQEYGLENDSYPADMQAALDAAKAAGMRSATLSGSRFESPYNGDVVVDIGIHGVIFSARLNETIVGTIKKGPDEQAKARRDTAILHENDRR